MNRARFGPEVAAGLAAFGGPLVLYVLTLVPGVAYWDIGEMQTVPNVLGIPHPTGFPLFVLAGWLFAHLVPIGEPAWRLTLFSALASAGSAWLLWSFVRDVTGSARLGVAAAFVFAAGSVVWTRAIRAEVHDLALFCTTLALVAARRAGETKSKRALFVAALASGLGLATHPIALFALPCVALFAWPAVRAASATIRVRAAAIALAPLLLYAYFPLRSAFGAAHGLDPNVDLGLRGSAMFDDGSPSTMLRFWQYVSGATFVPGSTFAAIFTAPGLARIAALWQALALQEFGYVLLAFALLGFGVLARTERRLAVGFAALLLADVTFAANYAVEIDVLRYALVPIWAIVACAAIGVRAAVVTIVREWSPFAKWIAFATMLVTLWPGAIGAYADARSLVAFEDARSIGAGIAAHTEDGSVIVATWNFATPLTYDKYVAHAIGSRRVVCGWPPSFVKFFPRWRERFHHVYFVVAEKYDASPIGHRIYGEGRWQVGEIR